MAKIDLSSISRSHRENGRRINCSKFHFYLCEESFMRKKRCRIGRSGNKRTIQPRLMGDNRRCCLHHHFLAMQSSLLFFAQSADILYYVLHHNNRLVSSFSFDQKCLRLIKKVTRKNTVRLVNRIGVCFKLCEKSIFVIYSYMLIFYRCIVVRIISTKIIEKIAKWSKLSSRVSAYFVERGGLSSSSWLTNIILTVS